MTTPRSHPEERQAYAEFASCYAEEEYRRRQAEFYATWRRFNETFFDGRLRAPHFAVGRTAARSLGHVAAATDYGGQMQITLNGRLVFGSNPDLVVNPWPPAEGTRRFLDDLVLRFTVRQFVVETLGSEERGYRGFGPKFVQQANSIGALLGLRSVVARHRGPEGTEPLGRGWPHCVRPVGYYGDDITEHALDLAGGSEQPSPRPSEVPPRAFSAWLLHLLQRGRVKQARRLLERQLEAVRTWEESPPRPDPRAERGPAEEEGQAPGAVTLDLAWLDGNDGLAVRLAREIVQARAYWSVPLLADALEDAGCRDGRVLEHLRAPMHHGRRCWVLRLLLARSAE